MPQESDKKFFPRYDPQQPGPQYLEDLSTGYWLSETLFCAVEMGIFTLLHPDGKTAGEISDALGCPVQGMERFLHALCAMGLLHENNNSYYNTSVSRDYLVAGKPDYQGKSIMWRKDLGSYWADLKACLKAGGKVRCNTANEDPVHLRQRIEKYIDAMDCVARIKTREILRLFGDLPAGAEILDVGAGSGAVAAGFLDRIPLSKATLLDIPEVLGHAGGLMLARGHENRATCIAANILEPWRLDAGRYDLVILSNIIHAYSGAELPHILTQAARCLKEDGAMLIHDFFLEHYSEKAALFDMNMFVNTCNGKVFSQSTVLEELKRLNLPALEPVVLASDTAVLIAAKNKRALSAIEASLRIEKKDRLAARLNKLGFRDVRAIAAGSIHVADWVDLRCRCGCERYGSPHCPPNSPTPEKTRRLLADYSHALLIEGEPPGKTFQRKVLLAEREAFISGYHKAFSLWAGPCCLCNSCTPALKSTPDIYTECVNNKESRPSMEGAGIDVFETARRAGFSIRTLRAKNAFIKYFALLLLE